MKVLVIQGPEERGPIVEIRVYLLKTTPHEWLTEWEKEVVCSQGPKGRGPIKEIWVYL